MKLGQTINLNLINFLDGYVCFDHVRPKTSNRRNSGGIAVFIKSELFKVLPIVRIYECFDNCVVLHCKTSIYQGSRDTIMCFTYVSPEGSPIYHGKDEKDGIKLLEHCLQSIRSEYHNSALLIAGDLNARCKDFLDYIPDDSLAPIFGEISYDGDSFNLPRNTKDTLRFNSVGISLMELCCLLDVHIVNGRVASDFDGEYTCTANEWCQYS